MLGCHGATSLAIAPAYVIGALADFSDLDSPALLFEDRVNGIIFLNYYQVNS